MRLATDYVAKSDGAAPVEHDSGQILRYVDNGAAGAGATIVSGRYTNTAAAAGSAAVYATANLGAPVKRIGAEFSFGASGSTDGGSVAMIILTEDITDTFPTLPDAALHLTVTPTDWGADFIRGGSVVTGFAGTFDTPLATDGATTYRVEAQIENDACYLLLPDGNTAVCTDSRFSLGGSYPCFEIFENDASTDHRPQFARVWADTAPVETDRSQPSFSDLVLVATTAQKLVRPRFVFYTGGTANETANIPGASAEIDANLRISDLVVPDSGRILVEFSAFVTMVSAGRVFWVVEFGGTTDWVTQEVVNTTGYTNPADYAQMTTLRAVADGLSPGQIVDLRWHHWSTAANSGFVSLDNGGGHQPCITVWPVN